MGKRPVPLDTSAAVLLPDGVTGEAFLAYYPSFLAIRRYNPSDFYCISVGLLGDLVTS
jgi:membrane-bound lytic murein transglycosylase B